jgi:hypothetical protein
LHVELVSDASSGMWTQVLLSILITRATLAPLCHTEMARAWYNQSQENRS